jgi:hypothetical protein
MYNSTDKQARTPANGAPSVEVIAEREAARAVQAAARAAQITQLIAENPHLVVAGAKVDSLQAAAKNVRLELKRAFPKVKFSVSTKRFAGGDSLSVCWMDGPTTEQVDAIVDRYSAGSFNGMTDCYEHGNSAWTAAFGDAKYTHARREDSDAAVAAAIRTVFARYEGNLDGVARPSVEAFRSGSLYSVTVPGLNAGLYHDGMQSLINRELARRTWALRADCKAAAKVAA